MSDPANPVEGLKMAMLERAKKLAQEHREQGALSRQKILQETREKIQLMEQKELLLAKSLSERSYLRLVQSREIQLQAEQDRRRWGLVTAVLDGLQQRLITLQQDPLRYHPVFLRLFRHGSRAIPDTDLLATLNAVDLQRYRQRWQVLCTEVTTKQVDLNPEPIDCSGGIHLSSRDGEVILNNTFEGLLEHRQQALQQLIFERLFATTEGNGGGIHG